MRFFVFAFAAIAAASAASIASDYLPPNADISLPTQEYIPPTTNIEEPNPLPVEVGPQNEVASSEYLPPGAEIKQEVEGETLPEENTIVALAINEAPPVEAASEETAVLADDGYRYKTIRRIRYRYRRDVSELPLGKYLPSNAESNEKLLTEAAPAIDVPVLAAVAPEAKAADGYSYKTVRRIIYRHRRDVSELPSIKYLPTAAKSNEENLVQSVPQIDVPVLAEAAPESSSILADNGYHYKTVRRLRYRHRRDVNELPLNEYLPPTAESKDEVVVEAIPNTLIAPEAPVVDEATPEVPTTILADDGYRYKTVRRIRYRYRRDVNELPLNEYLPPTAHSKEEVVIEAVPETLVAPEAPVVAEATPEETAVLADDGYHYRTVRRIRYRQRRDVSELPSSEYIPAALDTITTQYVESAQVPTEDLAAFAGNDGYRYKAVHKLKYRRH